MAKAVFELEPFTCPSCVKKIETALNRIDGVDSAKVLFISSKVKIQFNTLLIEVSHLKETIEKLGYPVLSAKVS